MTSREQLIERFLEETFTVKELKEISGAIERIFTPEEVEDVMGSEMQHFLEFRGEAPEFIEKKFDANEKSILQIARKVKIQRELANEIEDWKHMGFEAKFKIAKDVVCILEPHPMINSSPIVGIAHLNNQDAFDEDVGCLIAILKAGYDDEYKEEIRRRGLEYIFKIKL